MLSELWLRQRVNFALIVCPSSVCLQWRDEMQQRFGLHFEVMTRAFVAERRKERGFGCNPWTTHHRFIISHPLLRRPEYRDPLLAHLGPRHHKSLLIFDEAHIAAPASHSLYAVDSQITRVIRDVAPRFENRLFLSATPHNGHTNSFSSLLELLDPQRFTRGVPISGRDALAPVMVRRLKQDLRAIGGETRFPLRRVLQWNLEHRPLDPLDGGATQLYLHERALRPEQGGYTVSTGPVDLGPAEPFELTLARDLARYTTLCSPQTGRGKLVFINLQKRLLSSVEAFARTLRVHARNMGPALAAEGQSPSAPARSPAANDHEGAESDHGGADDDGSAGWSDEELGAAEDARIAAQSRRLSHPSAEASKLLAQLQQQATQCRNLPDAKLRALIHWIQAHQCAAVRLGRLSSRPPVAGRKKAARAVEDLSWTERRLILFTEYGDTKRYLLQQLGAAMVGTDRADERLLQLHGGMGGKQRDAVQRAFNGDPAQHPVRILIATDAAREGLNPQAHCADLIHWDVPWNPARMEQRNGRIDRTLQPAPEVRCHYFSYAGRAEDPVLTCLVEKSETIKCELGSLSAVVMDRIETCLQARGLDADAAAALERISVLGADDGQAVVVKEEFEVARPDLTRLRAEIEEAGEILNASREQLEFDPALLRNALNGGFEWAGSGPMASDPTRAEAYYTGISNATREERFHEEWLSLCLG